MCFDIRIAISLHSWCIFTSSNEPKKLFVSNNITIVKARFQNFFKLNISQFFEKHNLYIMWFYALQFSSCKIVPFLFGCVFAASNWQFIGIRSCVIGAEFLWISSIRGWVVSALDSNLLGRRLESYTPSFCQFEAYFYIFFCHLIKLVFGLVLSNFWQLRLFVKRSVKQ